MSEHLPSLLNHAREIYLAHLRERFRLMQMIYVVAAGWIAISTASVAKPSLLYFSLSVLVIFAVLILWRMSVRVTLLIADARDVIKSLEQGMSPGEQQLQALHARVCWYAMAAL